MIKRIEEPNTSAKWRKDDKSCKEERVRKAFGYEHTGDDGIVIWDAIYKKGSVPKT
jgi:hypothetical protein